MRSLYEEIHPIKLGSLATVISAHPAHNKWFGIVVDRCFVEKPEQTTSTDEWKVIEDWEKRYNFTPKDFPIIGRSYWLYVGFGPSFLDVTSIENFLNTEALNPKPFLFLDVNLEVVKEQ